jgi:hypothetical protein
MAFWGDLLQCQRRKKGPAKTREAGRGCMTLSDETLKPWPFPKGIDDSNFPRARGNQKCRISFLGPLVVASGRRPRSPSVVLMIGCLIESIHRAAPTDMGTHSHIRARMRKNRRWAGETDLRPESRRGY